ncbi:helix-turn-helix transcriptional regulator [Salmonella enterica]|uniref:helix-turn-helix transcriptional regulator n=1 Tax=Salmonella enterica TaxID=28901 RepID=UPI0012FD347B|nr:AraC family transcriptional regulator [Salmonella enterica]
MKKLYEVISERYPKISHAKIASAPIIYSPCINSSIKDEVINIFYVQSGNPKLLFNKTEVKSITSGEVILFRRKSHDHFILSGDKKVSILHVEVSLCGLMQDSINCSNQYERLYILGDKYPNIIPTILEAIKLIISFRAASTLERTFLEIPTILFFIQLYLVVSSVPEILPCNNEHPLYKLMIDIVQKPGHSWRVSNMADKYNMTINTFISEFRKLSGYTPLCFLKKIRLDRGMLLLKKTDSPISVIASECGYNSPASFSSYIKKEFGKSPSQLRKEYRTKNKTV